MNYYALVAQWDESHAYVDGIPSNLKKKYQLLKGVSRSEDWPSDMAFKFSDNRAEGMVLTDWIQNAFALLLVSDRFKTVLEACEPDHIEYLPVAMADHRGEIVDGRYWVVNSLVLPPVVDRSKSIFEPAGADEGKMSKFEKLVLLEDVVDNGPAVIRPAEYPRIVLLREDLVEQLNAIDVTGVQFRASEEFKTHDPDD